MELASSNNFEWKDFLILSTRLLEDSESKNYVQCEAELRTIISRSYYSAHHVAKNVLVPTDQLQGDGKDHTIVISFLTSNSQFAGIGQRLSELKKQRIRADYNLPYVKNANASTTRPSPLRNQAKLAIKDAKYILDKIEELRGT